MAFRVLFLEADMLLVVLVVGEKLLTLHLQRNVFLLCSCS